MLPDSSVKILRPKIWLLIAFAYLLLSASYAILTPPWEAPDEPAHYIYVTELAAHWRPPPPSTIKPTAPFYSDQAFMTSNSEWSQPMMGYLPAAIAYRVLQAIAPGSLPNSIPLLNPEFGVDPFQHPRLFSSANPSLVETWKDNWGLLIIRILSAGWGLLVIYSTWRVGCWIDPSSDLLGIAAAGWVAFLPQITFIHATIRNDTMADGIAALVFLFATQLLSIPNKRNQTAFGLGVLLGLGMLTKFTFLVVVPVGFLAVILSDPRSPRSWLKPSLWMAIPMIAMNGAYYLVYPEARLALAYAGPFLAIRSDALTWGLLPTFVIQLFADLFYARFGWANVGPRSLFARAGATLWGLGVGLTLTQAIRGRHNPELRQPLKILALLGIGAVFAAIGVVRFNLAVYQPQGRFLFPAIIAWPLLGLWGLWQILPVKGKTLAAIMVPVGMLVFNLYSLSTLIAAYY